MCDAVVATSIVWDYTRDHVLLLTNNHLGCARVQVLLSPKSGRKLSREEDLCWESVEDFVVIQLYIDIKLIGLPNIPKRTNS